MTQINVKLLEKIQSKHIEVILKYYPSFKEEDITDIEIKDGFINFKHNDYHYTCFSKYTKDAAQKFSYWARFLTNFFEALYEETKKTSENNNYNISQELLENIKNIILNYFTFPKWIECVCDIKIEKWMIFFRYFDNIYVCPNRYISELKPEENPLELSKNVSLIIKDYLPNIDLKLIQDLTITDWMIVFSYKNVIHSCPFISLKDYQEKLIQAKQREDELEKETNKVKKACLKLVYSKK